MTDETNTPETDEVDLTPPDFLDRASPEVIAIVEKGRALTLDARKTELARATAPKTATPGPKAGSATAMAAKPKQVITKPEKVIDVPKPKAAAKVASSKKTDAEMIALIKEHREAAGGTAGKTLKVLRGMDISCSQERFKKLYAAAS